MTVDTRRYPQIAENEVFECHYMLIRIDDTFHPMFLSALYIGTPRNVCRKQNALHKNLKRTGIMYSFMNFRNILFMSGKWCAEGDFLFFCINCRLNNTYYSN